MLLTAFIVTPILLLIITFFCKINLKDNYLFWLFFGIFLFLFYFIPIINYGASGFSLIKFDSSAKGYVADVDTVRKLYIFQTLFYLLCLLGYKLIKPQTNPYDVIDKKTIPSIDKIVLLASIISFVGTLGSVYSSGMSLQQLINSSRFDYWETKSTGLHLISGYLQALLVVPAFLFPYIKKKIVKIFTLISLIALFIVEMMIFGSRSTFLAIGAAFLFGFISYIKYKSKKIKVKKLVIPSLLLLHLAIVWQYVRYNSSSFQTVSDWIKGVFNFKEAYSISLLSGDLNYFFATSSAAFDAIPKMHDYLYGTTYLRLFLFFLPSSLVSFKPEETQRIFANIINPSAYSIGATYPPSFIGDSYINFGFFGIIIGFFLGLFLRYSQNLLNGPLNINKITIGSSIFLFLFLFIRGTFNGMYNMIFVWIFLVVVTKLVSPKNKPNW